MIVGGVKYTDTPDYGFDAPYDGENIKSDRQGGWLVRHELMQEWITAVPDRALADRIYDGLSRMAEKIKSQKTESAAPPRHHKRNVAS